MGVAEGVANAGPLQRIEADEQRSSRRIAVDLVGFMDMVAVVAGGIAPALIYQFGGNLPVDWLKHLQICLISAAVVYACLRNFGMYDENRVNDLPTSPAYLLGALGIALTALLGLGLPFAPREMHMWVWYAVWISMSFMLLLNVRNAAHYILRRMTEAGRFDTRVAVYGNGPVARRVRDYLETPGLGLYFAGLYDDRNDTSRVDFDGPRIAGRLDDLVERARSGRIDRIIISLPQAADQRTQWIAAKLQHLPVSLHIVTHIASDLVEEGPALSVSSLGPVGLLDVKRKPLSDWQPIIKSVEDRVLGVALALLFAPMLVLAATAIKLDSKGPVFFRQRRTGLNGETIEVVKFRTMHVLQDGPNVPQATRNDPRITRVGGFLRRWSIDELPQLYNVLKGEMSLVGPRPHALAHDERFAEVFARYRSRHQVKPGITGLAQVEGYRGEITTPQMLAHRIEKDIEYLNAWSLWKDLAIIARTPLSCLKSETAY
ncbi:MAG: undecaprenyl-phosphate glucose phosphotransferase [Hyphomicrobiaceae bacterium]